MKRLIAILFLVVVSTILYGLTIRGFEGNPFSDKINRNLSESPGPFESSHERAPYALTYSLVENGSFALNKELADFASPDTVIKDDTFYIIFPPGISLLAMPFYNIGKAYSAAQLITFAGMTLFALFNLVLVYTISKHVFSIPTNLSLFSALIFGFATTSWSFASSLYQHHTTTFFVLTSFLAAWLYKTRLRTKWIWASWIWFSLGISVWLDYPSVILFAPIIFFMILSSLKLKKVGDNFKIKIILIPLITSVIFISLAAFHGYYNHVNFGGWKNLAQLEPRYDTKLLNETTDEKKLDEIAKAEKTKSIEGVATENQFFRGFYILTIAPDKGIFFFSPILLLAVLGIIQSFKVIKKKLIELITFSSIFFINIFFYSSWGDPWGGWAYGPRYLIPSMAVLSIFTVIWLWINRHNIIVRIIASVLFIYSAAIATLGAVTTTITPPKVEADFLKLKYGFFNNWEVFINGKSGSFFYNKFLDNYVDLTQFYSIILIFVSVYGLLLLFIKTSSREHGN